MLYARLHAQDHRELWVDGLVAVHSRDARDLVMQADVLALHAHSSPRS